MRSRKEFYERHRQGETSFRYERAPRTQIAGWYEGCDFSGADLRQCQVDGTFNDCKFVSTRFDSARLRGVYTGCDFTYSSLTSADIANATLGRCDFSKTSMVDAQLATVTFAQCLMLETRLTRAVLRNVAFHATKAYAVLLTATTFSDTSIEPFCSALATQDNTRAVVDWRSVCRSLRTPELETFLLRSGMADIFVRYVCDCARALDPDMLFKLMRSTFISHGEPDALFALRLNETLRANGVETFLFSKNARPGERMHRVMRDGINKYDRMILVCSERSLERHGVQNEIEECLSREARDGGASYLIPVTLDDYVFVAPEWHASVIRDRVVADFRGAEEDNENGTQEDNANARRKFRDSVQRLLSVLKRDGVSLPYGA